MRRSRTKHGRSSKVRGRALAIQDRATVSTGAWEVDVADGIATLKERHPRKMDRLEQAIDAALAAYARQHDGRFIRFSSTAEERMRSHSDVDIIADFPEKASIAAASVSEKACLSNNMAPHAHAGAYLSPSFKAEAERRGRHRMMADLWADIDRNLATSRQHFGMAVDGFAGSGL